MSTASRPSPIVAVSQRVDVWVGRGERRDALDQRLVQWLTAAGCVPVPVPNTLTARFRAEHDDDWIGLRRWLIAVKPDALLLSGGNDIGETPERDNTERRLLTYARDRSLPVLGICRGMQMMGEWAGGRLVPVDGHICTRHRLQVATGIGGWPDEVNSFHRSALADCPPWFVVTARSEDGVIEGIRHESLNWEGWMWHPERESPGSERDLFRFRALMEERIAC